MKNKKDIPQNCGNNSVSEQELFEMREMNYNWSIMTTSESLRTIQQDQIRFYNKAVAWVKSATNPYELELAVRNMQRNLESINKAERLMDFYGFEYTPFVPYC